jgi:hypothetical protein
MCLPALETVTAQRKALGKVQIYALTPNDERLRNLSIFIEGAGIRRVLRPNGFDGENENGGLVERVRSKRLLDFGLSYCFLKILAAPSRLNISP